MKSRRTRRADSPETSSGFSKFFGSLLTQGDLSRLGRNYLEVGRYTEVIFPENKVRFIAITDGVDSAAGDNEFAPFKNIINEWYAKDISRKVQVGVQGKGTAWGIHGRVPAVWL